MKRKGKDFYYHKENSECDFVIKNNLKIVEAIQVCFNFNEKNEKRELDGLLEAMKKFNLNEGIILTYDQEKEFKVENKNIIIKSIWRWLIE